jgi:hypothetical protein
MDSSKRDTKTLEVFWSQTALLPLTITIVMKPFCLLTLMWPALVPYCKNACSLLSSRNTPPLFQGTERYWAQFYLLWKTEQEYGIQWVVPCSYWS